MMLLREDFDCFRGQPERQRRQAYPARDERVICIHATDGKGKDSGGINPSPLSSNDNFCNSGARHRDLLVR